MDTQNLTTVEQTNALVLANAAEVVALVVGRIAGNDISNTIHGETASKERLSLLVMGQLTRHLVNQTK